MTSGGHPLPAVVQELHLLKHSLLPGERMTLISSSVVRERWERAINNVDDEELYGLAESLQLDADELLSVSFELADCNWRGVWFEVTVNGVTSDNRNDSGEWYEVSVKGEQLRREDQARLQGLVRGKRREVEEQGSDYPLYQLVSEHLLPLLHAESMASPVSHGSTGALSNAHKSPGLTFHALLTSHHLKSTNKRRSMAHWAAQLHLSGFAKVGHPGVMYAEGAREHVEEFVQNVKAMQWLALRVRFVEPLPNNLQPATEKRWKEFEKVGEVVDEMKRLGGREAFVVEMGIGSTK